jgi:flagellin-like protein
MKHKHNQNIDKQTEARDDRAVAPVIGAVMLVMITVMVGGAFSVSALGFTDNLEDEPTLGECLPSQSTTPIYEDACDDESKMTTGQLRYTWHKTTGGTASSASDMDAMFNTGSANTGIHNGKVSWHTAFWVSYGDKPDYISADDKYAWKAEGYVYAPEAGEYEIGLDADDASDVFIDGNPTVSWYGAHSVNQNYNRKETITLEEGWHTVAIRMQDNYGNDGVSVAWETPGSDSYTPIPAEAFGTK